MYDQNKCHFASLMLLIGSLNVILTLHREVGNLISYAVQISSRVTESHEFYINFYVQYIERYTVYRYMYYALT